MKTGLVCRNEKGAALITGLVLLLVLTLIGIAAMQGATLQERMAGNLEQESLALQAAETGLRDAEAWIATEDDDGGLPEFNNTNGLYTFDPSGAPRWESIDWNDASQYRGDKPRYIIEYMEHIGTLESDSVAHGSFDDDVSAYRITSRGTSPNGRSVVILQSTFIR